MGITVMSLADATLRAKTSLMASASPFTAAAASRFRTTTSLARKPACKANSTETAPKNGPTTPLKPCAQPRNGRPKLTHQTALPVAA
jgi:hypothetical protein